MLWTVTLKGKIIDVVSFDNEIPASEVRTSLINHDMYSNDIEVSAYVPPTYDTTYIAEKATLIIKGANEILDAINKPQTKNTRSHYVSGILGIEMALNGLHLKIRQIMNQCNESEDDYMLRHMGKLENR